MKCRQPLPPGAYAAAQGAGAAHGTLRSSPLMLPAPQSDTPDSLAGVTVGERSSRSTIRPRSRWAATRSCGESSAPIALVPRCRRPRGSTSEPLAGRPLVRIVFRKGRPGDLGVPGSSAALFSSRPTPCPKRRSLPPAGREATEPGAGALLRLTELPRTDLQSQPRKASLASSADGENSVRYSPLPLSAGYRRSVARVSAAADIERASQPHPGKPRGSPAGGGRKEASGCVLREARDRAVPSARRREEFAPPRVLRHSVAGRSLRECRAAGSPGVLAFDHAI